MRKSYEETLQNAILGPDPSNSYQYYCYLEDMIKEMETGITEEVAQAQIPNAIPGVKTLDWVKKSAGTIGELVGLSYPDYMKIRGIGEKSRDSLYEYIHSLGYTTPLDRMEIIKHCVELKKNNEKIELLDKLGLSKKVLFLLYFNGLYTMDDLANIGADIYEIKGFNDADRREINNKIGDIISVLGANKLLMMRIKEKEAKLDEYQRQVAQYNALLTREACLDKMIGQTNLEEEKKPATR